MKRTLITITLIMFALAAWAAVRPQDPHAVANPDPNHVHADFAVWILDKEIDFSGPEFMSAPPAEDQASALVPTAVAHGDEDDGHVVPGREYLHLHDGNGHVIHRHKPGLTIGDFFTSLGIDMTEECLQPLPTDYMDGKICSDLSGDPHWMMFINGKEVEWNPGYEFQDLDQILLTFQYTNPVFHQSTVKSKENIRKQLESLTDDACRYSQRCPWKGKPPVENCIADPAVPCTE